MKKRLLYAAFLFACNTCGKEISPLQRRAKGFPVIVAPLSADSPLARRRPLETFGAVLSMLYFFAGQ